MKYLIALASLVLAVPTIAQDLKAELLSKEQQARGNADALTQVAVWAKENGLGSDAARILKKVLEMDSNHVAANRALGNVEYLGHWMSRDEMYKSMGLVQVEGVWIEKGHRDDAKEGIFHNGDELVSRAELASIQTGKIRHKWTGEFIAEEDAGKVEQGLYPLAAGKWGTLEEANAYHSSSEHPWVVRTPHTTLVCTLPLDGEVSIYKSIWPYVEYGADIVTKMFGVEPKPANRPVVAVAASVEEYSEFGNVFGGSESSHAVFVLEQNEQEWAMPGLTGFTPPVFVNYGEKNWEDINLRHAGALAAIEALRRDIDAPPLQPWFVRGVAACAGRLPEPKWAGSNGEFDIVNGGGVDENLKRWFESWRLEGGLEWKAMAHNIFQAGLMIRFAENFGQEGPDSRVSDNWKDVVEVFQEGNGRGAFRAIDKLQKSYYTKYDELRTYLRKLIAQKDS